MKQQSQPASPLTLVVTDGVRVQRRDFEFTFCGSLNGGLVGRVDGDIGDLTLLMEPGQWRYSGDEGEAPTGERLPRDKPLRGAIL